MYVLKLHKEELRAKDLQLIKHIVLFVIEEMIALTINPCGHRICARHFYRDYIQTNNRNCTACQENNIQLILSNLSEDFLEQFRQLERNMRRDRDFGRPGGISIQNC